MKLEDLKKMLEEQKSEEKPMDEKSVKAKMDVIDELRKMMMDGSADSIMDGMQQVKVAAPDKESLKKGLEMALDKIDDMGEMPEMSEDEEDEEDEEEKKRRKR